MGFTLKHTSVLSNNKGREMWSQVVWRDTVAHEPQGFHPLLELIRRCGCAGCGDLAGPQAPTALWGEPRPFPHFEQRIKSHIILIKTELFCRPPSLQGCAPIATHIINFRGAALKSVAQSYWWEAIVLEAGGCGEPCENKCFCVPTSLCTECTLNLRVAALWTGSKLSPRYCLCHTIMGVSLCLQHLMEQPP